MGILRAIAGGDNDPPGFDPAAILPDAGRQTINHAGVVYDCETASSPDGQWTLAYGRRRDARDAAESRIFRLNGNRVIDDRPADRPTAAAIANDGSAAVVESRSANTTMTQLRVIDAAGEEQLTEPFDATLRRPAISADGQFVAVITRPPTVAVEIFSVPDRHRMGRFELAGRRGRLLGFHRSASGKILYIATGSNDTPYVGLSVKCEVEWKSDRYRMSQPLADRIRGWIGATRSNAGNNH